MAVKNGKQIPSLGCIAGTLFQCLCQHRNAKIVTCLFTFYDYNKYYETKKTHIDVDGNFYIHEFYQK